MNADHARRMKKGLSVKMKRLATARQCPSCMRGYALERIHGDLPGETILVCRWCGYERALAAREGK